MYCLNCKLILSPINGKLRSFILLVNWLPQWLVCGFASSYLPEWDGVPFGTPPLITKYGVLLHRIRKEIGDTFVWAGSVHC